MERFLAMDAILDWSLDLASNSNKAELKNMIFIDGIQ